MARLKTETGGIFFERLCEIPVIDAHTHLVSGKLGARGLHDIILYHMAVSELYAAGCPDGARLTQFPGWPDKKEAHSRIKRALPYLEKTFNTSVSWCARIILNDLYGWREPVTAENWERLDALIRERNDDALWHREILRRAGIDKACTELARRDSPAADDILRYALEWAFFTRCQRGEYDTPLYELERCWGKQPGPPMPVKSGGPRPPAEKTVRTLDDVRAAVRYYTDTIPSDKVSSIATHISMDLDLSPVTDGEMSRALKKRGEAGKRERDIFASYINELFLTELEARGGKVVFQFSFGAEPLGFETSGRLSQTAIAQAAEMIARHPGIRFQCFLSSLHANQSMCTLCRQLPNLSLAGYWWHNFFPRAMRQIMEERLDMLPVSRQTGFFSDAYCAEWAYAKLALTRRLLAEVFSTRINCGQYSPDDAEKIAREILHRSPLELLNLEAHRAF
jgi:glucuronate isomerase